MHFHSLYTRDSRAAHIWVFSLLVALFLAFLFDLSFFFFFFLAENLSPIPPLPLRFAASAYPLIP